MVTLVNISKGNLHLDSLDKTLAPGDRISFNCKPEELLIKAPEIALFIERSRVKLS